MKHRDLYLVAYDVTDPRRLRRLLTLLKEYALGGQKSVFECYLTEGERKALLTRARERIDPSEDRLLMVRLNRRARVTTLGIAMPPQDDTYFYAG